MSAIAPMSTGLEIPEEEVTRYLVNGKDFVDVAAIERALEANRNCDAARIRDIVAKSLDLIRLEPDETAALLNVEDEGLWEEIAAAAGQIKNKVYGPRVVVFAPLYCSNLCVNSCVYCGFRSENRDQVRRRLGQAEIRAEIEALVQKGHKRLIVVFGEHPDSDVDYMVESLRTIYATKVGNGEIRRVNVNAAPMPVAKLRQLHDVGIGTYQVFQETYHPEAYRRAHPRGPKADFRRRLYALHRAQEAEVDDVGMGALFGLYDWRFEVMGLLAHTIDLERRFGGVGPHTISFPRLEPALNCPITKDSPHLVSDRDFLRLIAVLRLSVPYTGMIITAREKAEIRRAAFKLGCTQTDASTRIGVGAYSESGKDQELARQQFMLGDTRELDDMVREFAEMGLLTSFCTAGYRCGRTGHYFMDIAKTGKVHHFCIPNAVLTLMEYLDDYASEATRSAGMKVIRERLPDIPASVRTLVEEKLAEINDGHRDVYL